MSGAGNKTSTAHAWKKWDRFGRVCTQDELSRDVYREAWAVAGGASGHW